MSGFHVIGDGAYGADDGGDDEGYDAPADGDDDGGYDSPTDGDDDMGGDESRARPEYVSTIERDEGICSICIVSSRTGVY